MENLEKELDILKNEISYLKKEIENCNKINTSQNKENFDQQQQIDLSNKKDRMQDLRLDVNQTRNNYQDKDIADNQNAIEKNTHDDKMRQYNQDMIDWKQDVNARRQGYKIEDNKKSIDKIFEELSSKTDKDSSQESRLTTLFKLIYDIDKKVTFGKVLSLIIGCVVGSVLASVLVVILCL